MKVLVVTCPKTAIFIALDFYFYFYNHIHSYCTLTPLFCSWHIHIHTMQRPTDPAAHRIYSTASPYASTQSLLAMANHSSQSMNNNNNGHIHINNTTTTNLFSINIISCLLVWYAISSLTTQLTKHILSEFEFPVFVGEFQFGFNFLLGLATIYLAKYSITFKSWFPQNTLPSTNTFAFNKHLAKLFFPMGTFQFVGKLFSLAATSICTVATVSSIRALSPLFIVLGYRINYKVQFSLKTYVSLIPLLMGVIIMVLSQTKNKTDDVSNKKVTVYNELVDTNADKANETNTLIESTISTFTDSIQIHGIFFALLSTIVFAAGSIYTKSVLSTSATLNNTPISAKKEKKEIAKLALFSGESTLNLQSLDIEKNDCFEEKIKPQSIDKLTTLMYCSLYGLVYSIPTLLTYELPTLLSLKTFPANIDSTPIIQPASVPYYTLIPWFLLIINGVSYFTQSLLAFHILGMLPTVTYSIANMMKRIIVIAISMVIRGHSLSLLEFLGLLHVSIGLYVYEKWGSKQN